MATAEQIISQIKAYSTRDDEKFKIVALQIAAHEAMLGHGSIAQELKKEIANVRKSSPFIKTNPNHSSMLDYSMPSIALTDLIADVTTLSIVK